MLAWAALLSFAQDALPPAAATKIDFARDVAPLFEKRCFLCHGPQQQMNGLRLDRRADALKGSKNGPVIVPRNGAGSRLIQLVGGVAADKKVMPPVGPRLTATEVGLLRAWIDQGARLARKSDGGCVRSALVPAESHSIPTRQWSAIVPGRVMPSTVSCWRSLRIGGASRRRPKPSKTALIRRVSSRSYGSAALRSKRVRDFLGDNSTDAYQRLVDHLLDSPHYGEKWARYWLDLARYADSDGYEKDRTRPWAWRYRQWASSKLSIAICHSTNSPWNRSPATCS